MATNVTCHIAQQTPVVLTQPQAMVLALPMEPIITMTLPAPMPILTGAYSTLSTTVAIRVDNGELQAHQNGTI